MLAGAAQPPRRYARSPEALRREARRRRFLRRRILALFALIALLGALYYGLSWAIARSAAWFAKEPSAGAPIADTPPPSPPPPTQPLTFKPERFIELEGRSERIAVGPSVGALRLIALVTGPDRNPRLIGAEVSIPDFPLALTNLPRADGVLVLAGMLPRSGAPVPTKVGDQPALIAQGGEPDMLAWFPDSQRGLVPVPYYELAAPLTPPAPTSLVLDKYLNVLWYYEAGRLIQTARVATGQHLQGPPPSRQNQMQNYLTPLGRFTIETKMVDPFYHPDNIKGGDPQNPLGRRFMGFSVYDGDDAAVWGIHGTNEPELIGQWASKGCIRLHNAEIELLFERVKTGTPLEIRESRPAGS